MTLNRAAELIAYSLRLAADEHGRPNTWSPGELLDFGYCDVSPALQGRVAGNSVAVGVLVTKLRGLGWQGSLPAYSKRRWAI